MNIYKFHSCLNVQCVCAHQEILNHCFDDVERFMGRLQQAAEAQSVINQSKKKRSRKSKKGDQEGERIGAFLSITIQCSHVHSAAWVRGK